MRPQRKVIKQEKLDSIGDHEFGIQNKTRQDRQGPISNGYLSRYQLRARPKRESMSISSGKIKDPPPISVISGKALNIFDASGRVRGHKQSFGTVKSTGIDPRAMDFVVELRNTMCPANTYVRRCIHPWQIETALRPYSPTVDRKPCKCKTSVCRFAGDPSRRD